MKDHQLFEIIVAELHEFLSPSSTVKQNQKIQGRSGVTRQIDILIEDNTSVYPIKVVVDCKHYKSKVDIKEVEAVWMLVDDVRANLGIIICNAGYTEGALKRAKDIGLLKLCSVLDLQNKGFSVKIALPVVMEKTEPQLRTTISPQKLSRLLSSEPKEIILTNTKTGQKTSLYHLFHEKILEEIDIKGTGFVHLAPDEWQLV
ncbi:MAG TPA: restriction endonuclease, partial [Methylomirabilota bacterium]|nr:restriction endonuclease [Methylomirabilota bacterium]